MLVAIIADSHDNLDNLKKAMDWCRKNKVVKIICLGDITKLESVSYLAHNFSGEIFVVRGNADLYADDDLKNFANINYAGLIGYASLGGLSVGFCHEPGRLEKLFAEAPVKVDFAFFGHTHRPGLEKRDNVQIANPGYLAAVFSAASFAVLDTATENLELKILPNL